ncbi:universal stress protein [Streptomyces sp. NPDC053431]|uniref:universal stress protein n=1 Tax=Streptomyces sp. NPDC053431 TaxID=3365703 RepID=UPI0037D791F5
MTAQVTVGLDGSEESVAAARWAAREAMLREVPLRLVLVDDWPDPPEIPALYLRVHAERAERLIRDAEEARAQHPDLEVFTERAHGRAAETLTAAANDADLTVLGSRGLGGVLGFVVGSVSLSVVGATRQPVVLVRAKGERPTPSRAGIVVGVDIYHPCESLLGFAFTEAARTGLPLRFLHSWTLPASYGYATLADPGIGEELGDRLVGGLDDLLEPWRRRYPGVAVTARAAMGPAAFHLVEASQDADLVVVGRRTRRIPVGPHLGHVAHAVIHHSPAPVAVVPLA